MAFSDSYGVRYVCIFSLFFYLLTLLLGAAIAGATDVTFDFSGYFFALASCIFQALYLVLVKKVAVDIRLY